MTTHNAIQEPRLSWGRKIIRFPLTRIVVAVFATALAAAMATSFANAIADKSARILWPDLLAAGAVLLAYWLYVRWFERRPVTELSRRRALPEFSAGLLLGAMLVALVVGASYALGTYQATGVNGWNLQLATPLATMVFVGVFEEVLSRGIVFRIVEQSLGSWAALAVSSLLFGLAHAPGESAGFLAILIAVVAGAFFAAAYMFTRRLWLCIGIHVAWNYTLGSIFSIAVSGREAKGLLLGRLSGPDWLTGGAYGLEASILTLLVLTAVGVWLLWGAWRKGHFVAPFWRTRLARSAHQATA